MSHRTIWGGIGFRLGLKSCQGLPWFWFAFNGFEDAVSAARQGTNCPWTWILLRFLCFACGCNAGVSLLVVALLGFSLLVVASSFCFFRPSERNVREFYGGWFWQVWAWILLGFPCFACMPHRTLWLPLEAWILPGFAMVLLCFLTVSQMLFRQPVWGRSDHPLRLNPAGASMFRMHVPQNHLRRNWLPLRA